MKRQYCLLAFIICYFLTSILYYQTSNWSSTIKFSVENTEDLLELTVGENSSAETLTKPPAPPSSKYTNDPLDDIVSAYIFSEGRNLSKSIELPATQEPNKFIGKIWKFGIVSDKIDKNITLNRQISEGYPYKNLVLIDPTEKKKCDLLNSQCENVFKTSSNSETPKILYLIAGNSSSFINVDNNKLIGRIELVGNQKHDGIKVMIGGSETSTDENGFFTADNVTSGTIITFSKKRYLTKKFNIGDSSSFTTGVLDLCGGDADNSNKVDINDLSILKKNYGKECNATGEEECADFDYKGKVDINDLSILKKCYGQKSDL